MSEHTSAPKSSQDPPAIPYADPALRIGGADYRQMEYPADHSGFWNPARVCHNGTILRLQPRAPVLRIVFMIVVLVGIVATMALTSNRPSGHRAVLMFTVRLLMWVLFLFAVLVLPGIYAMRRRTNTPWLLVDVREKILQLPRAKRKIPFSDVIRLQLVSFAPVGASWYSLRSTARQNLGELQIVFRDRGQEATWCIVASLDVKVLKQFVARFVTATAIPVARVNYLESGEWEVEKF